MLKWLQHNRLGTHLFTSRHGVLAGEDDYGNRYYKKERGHDWRDERRWVVYASEGELEASSIPAGWSAWLHKNREKSPSEEPDKIKFWEKPHQANLSGTDQAYVPDGHDSLGGSRRPSTGDYKPWHPED